MHRWPSYRPRAPGGWRVATAPCVISSRSYSDRRAMEREIDCSIIVPVYNWAALTRRCIEQVLSRPPVGLEWELIIVDDGSDDGTQQVLAAFGTKIKVVRHRPN